jgi:hypothetical protein
MLMFFARHAACKNLDPALFPFIEGKAGYGQNHSLPLSMAVIFVVIFIFKTVIN